MTVFLSLRGTFLPQVVEGEELAVGSGTDGDVRY